ncbi:hypothetical protein KJ855_02845 [Patescibacteria group bacterium]|nr:hypothetical protein [Patescibacteria group bacterium]
MKLAENGNKIIEERYWLSQYSRGCFGEEHVVVKEYGDQKLYISPEDKVIKEGEEVIIGLNDSGVYTDILSSDEAIKSIILSALKDLEKKVDSEKIYRQIKDGERTIGEICDEYKKT